jgi:DNA-binding CsgD family transcriptional regulator
MSAFVGRAEELEVLDAVGRVAAAGDVRAVVLVGEPGTGKSRLLMQAASRSVLARQFRVVGYEAEQQVPLAAATHLLRALVERSNAGRRLGELLLGAPPADASMLEPVRILEATHRALGAAGPALLVVDDLQWVDDLSLALCHYLVRAAEDSGDPLGVIAAGRPSRNETLLSESLGQVLPPPRVTRRELRPLPSGEALELVRALAPTLGDEEAGAILAAAGGYPFWLEALVRTGGVDADAGRLVTARLCGASADAGVVVALLAVAGRPLGLADVARLNGWSTGRTEHVARELVTRGIALDSGAVVRLAHDLIRAAAVREIPDEQRIDIHGRLGDWLAEIAGDDVRRLREALGHRHAAGLPCLELAARLVRSPHRTLLGDDGLILLVAIAGEADLRDLAVATLNQEIAALAAALGRHDVALERNLVRAELAQDAPARARALLDASKSERAINDNAAARAYLDRARATFDEDELLTVELDVQQAVLDLWGEGSTQRGRALAHEAAAKALQLFRVDERARGICLDALRAEYDAAYQEDDDQTTLRVAEERARISRGFDDEAYLTALLASARALRRIGRLDEGLARSQHVWDEAGNRVLPRLAVDAGYSLGAFLLQKGRVSDARDVAAAVLELVLRVGDEARGRHSLERLTSEIDFYSNDWRRGIERLLVYTRGAGEHARVELHQLAALWLALAGRDEVADQVRSQLATARACAEKAGCPRCATELRLVGADALAHAGCRSDAAQSLAEWQRMQRRPLARDRYVQRRVEALLREPRDSALLETAAREAEELGFGLDALWTRLDLAASLARDDRARAKETFALVAETAAEQGAQTITDLAEHALRALGVRTWRRGADHGLLTERELAIAHLIAAGDSNPEIAQRLFLSRKTVERHVSNALRKTGARNRAELAARVAELEVEGAHR